ncbi:hypothetical protein GGF31_005853 [Allomyces arbusculus]|nr:hypothetical protein GGF31_005853 [Allomyces arbusculus]
MTATIDSDPAQLSGASASLASDAASSSSPSAPTPASIPTTSAAPSAPTSPTALQVQPVHPAALGATIFDEGVTPSSAVQDEAPTSAMLSVLSSSNRAAEGLTTATNQCDQEGHESQTEEVGKETTDNQDQPAQGQSAQTTMTTSSNGPTGNGTTQEPSSSTTEAECTAAQATTAPSPPALSFTFPNLDLQSMAELSNALAKVGSLNLGSLTPASAPPAASPAAPPSTTTSAPWSAHVPLVQDPLQRAASHSPVRSHLQNEPNGSTSAPRSPTSRILITNLPADVQWQELKDFGRLVGEVIMADMIRDNHGRPTEQGVILFRTPADAAQAVRELNGRHFMGRQVQVIEDHEDRGGMFRVTDGITRAPGGPPNPCRVYVSKLSYRVNSERLRELFSPAGEIERADVLVNGETGLSRGTGTVLFRDPQGALRAIEMFNGMTIDNMSMIVSPDRGVRGSMVPFHMRPPNERQQHALPPPPPRARTRSRSRSPPRRAAFPAPATIDRYVSAPRGRFDDRDRRRRSRSRSRDRDRTRGYRRSRSRSRDRDPRRRPRSRSPPRRRDDGRAPPLGATPLATAGAVPGLLPLAPGMPPVAGLPAALAANPAAAMAAAAQLATMMGGAGAVPGAVPGMDVMGLLSAFMAGGGNPAQLAQLPQLAQPAQVPQPAATYPMPTYNPVAGLPSSSYLPTTSAAAAPQGGYYGVAPPAFPAPGVAPSYAPSATFAAPGAPMFPAVQQQQPQPPQAPYGYQPYYQPK